MKLLRPWFLAAAGISLALAALTASAADSTPAKEKAYPLKTCVVSGDKLGEMGDPYVYHYKGREIRFCCKNCVKDFEKDPAKYLKLIDEAEAKAAKAKS